MPERASGKSRCGESPGRSHAPVNAYLCDMPVINLVLNILWIITGGAWMALGWLIAAVLLAVTIVGIPWAWAALRIALYTFLPFGYRVVPRALLTGEDNIGTGPLGMLGNLIWLVLAGWWLALGHLVTAVLLAVTLIGIPFAWAHLKLAGLALWPIGHAVVPADRWHRMPTWR
jgi:uncharacterized membrane protein YccF (DUF307 family)